MKNLCDFLFENTIFRGVPDKKHGIWIQINSKHGSFIWSSDFIHVGQKKSGPEPWIQEKSRPGSRSRPLSSAQCGVQFISSKNVSLKYFLGDERSKPWLKLMLYQI